MRNDTFEEKKTAVLSKQAKFFHLLSLFTGSLIAHPQGGSVKAGEGTIHAPSGNKMEISLSSRAVIEWEAFSVGRGEKLSFLQPSKEAAVLNRVIGKEVSAIFGSIEAPGSVYLINPQGVIFGKEAVIATGSFCASTLDVSDDEFLLGQELLFSGPSEASIVNLGTIQGKNGKVSLFAHRVENKGMITSAETVSLGASHEVLLQPQGREAIFIRPGAAGAGILNEGMITAEQIHFLAEGNPYSFAIEQSGMLDAMNVRKEEGKIFLRAEKGELVVKGLCKADKGEVALEALDALVTNEGRLQAAEGRIKISSVASGEDSQRPVYNFGTITTSGFRGGSIDIRAVKFQNSKEILAEGGGDYGGEITIAVDKALIETARSRLSVNGAKAGGSILLRSGSYFSSGSLEAKGSYGGIIALASSQAALAKTSIDVSGKEKGGRIFLGKEETGRFFLSADTTVSFHASQGPAGSVALKGGFSGAGAERLQTPILGVSTPPPEAYCFCGTLEYIDPNGAQPSNTFGRHILSLPNGNVVVTKEADDFAANNAGAVYLYEGATGALISTLRGSLANDEVGRNLLQLTNGNYLVYELSWNGFRGAVTWCDQNSGINGSVSAANSIVGSNPFDQVGTGILALTNGNYVISSSTWPTVAPVNAGAVTWGNGLGGTVGAVSAANSLVGTTASDQVGDVVIALSNGNYAVGSSRWDNGAIVDAGAVTWGNGLGGTVGPVTAANSLVGTTAGDRVGVDLIALTNGNFVAGSRFWRNGVILDAGAATWCNGAGGTIGPVTIANSLVGSTAGDEVGRFLKALTNGNYVTATQLWDNGATVDVGAATWGNGLGGTVGAVSAANSLIGGTANDQVSNSNDPILALTNGNYVVGSLEWQNAGISVGAATWCTGAGPTSAVVSAANSIIGSTAGDGVGKDLFALTNGNYVVGSDLWDNGAITQAGAVTWGSGTGPTSLVVSPANSLVGTSTLDSIPSGPVGVLPLANGNYVVMTPFWDNPSGPIADVGMAAWCDGATGSTVGPITSANSLIGATAADTIGQYGVALPNGNYVVISGNWQSSPGVAVGAATWGNGLGGTTGFISAANSLIGSTNGDAVGGITNTGRYLVPSGDLVVASTNWNAQTGAVSFCNQATGAWCRTYGPVTTSNSVIGSNPAAGLNDAIVIDPVNQTMIVNFTNDLGAPRVYAITYDCPVPIPEVIRVPAAGAHDYLRALSEGFQRWTATNWGAFFSVDDYPPFKTEKDLVLNPNPVVPRGIFRAKPMTYYEEN